MCITARWQHQQRVRHGWMMPALPGNTPARSGGAGRPVSELCYLPAKLPTTYCWAERFLHWAASWARCCARASSGVAEVKSHQPLLVSEGTWIEVPVSSGHATRCDGGIMAPLMMHAQQLCLSSPFNFPTRPCELHRTHTSHQLVATGHRPELERARTSSQ